MHHHHHHRDDKMTTRSILKGRGGSRKRRLFSNAAAMAYLTLAGSLHHQPVAGAFILHPNHHVQAAPCYTSSIIDDHNTRGRIPSPPSSSPFHHPLLSTMDSGNSPSSSSQQGLHAHDENWASLPDAPGPIRWPIVGNMITALKVGGIHKFDEVMKAKYGNVVRTKILGFPLYVISTPEAAREICSIRSKVCMLDDDDKSPWGTV